MNIIKTNNELKDSINQGIGFIYNDYSGKGKTGKFYNILHKANCQTLSKSHITSWKKYYFEDYNEAKIWLKQNRGQESINWKRCPICL